MMNIEEKITMEELGNCKQQQPYNVLIHTPIEPTRRDASQLFSNEIYVSYFFKYLSNVSSYRATNQ